MKRLPAFATMTALGVMVLLTTYLSIGVQQSRQSLIRLSVATPQVEARAHAWELVDRALLDLAKTWNPKTLTFAEWSRGHPVPELDWYSISGRLNINSVSAFWFLLPRVALTLKRPPDALTAYRSHLGLTSDLSAYKDWIQPSVLESWYTTHSLWNLNVADEIMLETLVTLRTGEATSGSSVRAWVRSFREKKERVETSDWDAQPATMRQAMAPIISLEPELDVNEAPESLLAVMLSDPAWNIDSPEAKAQTIVESRRSQPWNRERLRNLLGVPIDHPSLQALGTSTRFLAGTVDQAQGRLSVVVYLEPTKDNEPLPRIVESHWSPK